MSEHFFIVAIGAPSGGLEEINSFFDYTAPSGLAYVIIHHLSLENADSLIGLISRHSKLPVRLAGNGMRVKKDTVYLLPVDQVVTIESYCFLFQPADKAQSLNSTIDVFFKSLAACCGSKGIGVVLSGAGRDGTAYLKEIKNAGGAVIVRNPKTTVYCETPEIAIASGAADYIVEPELMPAVIAAIINESI